LPGARAVAGVDDATREALDDDLNAPLAITRLHELAAAINRAGDEAERGRLQGALAAGGHLLGLLGQPPEEWLRGSDADGSIIEERITARALARTERRFADADRIRDELAAEGILLEDRPGGTSWRRG
jgi:cysteinyl-tRNA synthetase